MSGAETCGSSGCGTHGCSAICSDIPRTALGVADGALRVDGNGSGCDSAERDGGVRARGEGAGPESIRSSRKLLVVVAKRLAESRLHCP